MDNRYDIAIIGTGPAGLSAALNAKIRNKKYILFGVSNCSTKVEKAHLINNYLGMPAISGKEMIESFKNHINQMGIEITDKKVTTIYPMGEYYSLLANNEVYEATTVILATGVQMGKLIPGEDTYLGRGVSYCATCDGGLYRDKVVTVVAYDKAEEEEANFLATLAAKVYYLPLYKEPVEVDASIEIIEGKPVEVVGEQFVSRLVLQDREIETDGLFILRATINPSALLPGIELDENHVKVDRTMTTSLPGCFAAGDIVGKPYQYIKAAGEGNIAALSAASYIDQLKHKAEQ